MQSKCEDTCFDSEENSHTRSLPMDRKYTVYDGIMKAERIRSVCFHWRLKLNFQTKIHGTARKKERDS